MTKRVAWGLFFIIAAVAVIAGGFGWLPRVGIFTMVLTMLCAVILISGIRDRSWPGILFPIAFLCILYDDYLGLTDITPGPVLGAALFGSIGLSMLFKSPNHHVYMSSRQCAENAENVSGNSVNMNMTLGGSTKYINTDEFERANVTCTFGAMKIYFDNAAMKTGEATVDLDVSFAGVELYIPKTWNVKINARTAFGAIDQKNRPNAEPGPVLHLIGDVSFGGVTIVYI